MAKSVLVLTVALWGFVGAFQNVLDWNGTIAAVNAATSMSTFSGGAESWQSTSNLLVVWIGALFIMLSKVASAVLCTIGGWRMLRTRNSSAEDFVAAKHIALTGCAIAVIMLFGGFIVIAESWFELWRSDAMRGPVLESAFRYAGMIMLIAVFVSSQED